MTRIQFCLAMLALFAGGIIGGTLVPQLGPAHAARVIAAPRINVRPRARPTPVAAPQKYFTSRMMMGVMTDDKGYQQLPALVVWRYGSPSDAVAGAATQQPRLQLVRMVKTVRRADLGKPTEWEYVLLPSPDSDEVFLFRYRVYEPPGGEPVAEYDYLGHEHPNYSGFGKPGMPQD